MAGQVPRTPPPAYAQQFGQMLQQTGANRADVLGAELESNSANLGHILGNLGKIAEVGGGALTPDRLLAAYAGSQGDIIDDQYSGMADRLRLAEQQANIARLNRSGTGGGKGDDPFSMDPDDALITLTDGTRTVAKVREGDDLRETLRALGIPPDRIADVQFGVRLGDDNQPIGGTGIPSFELNEADLEYLGG